MSFPVFLHPITREEYALARQEKKHGTGHTGFVCTFSPDVSLEEDLLRRDLTINAMARSANGELIDPYNGQQDLANKALRHVSPAFAEDPLRVLRAARFAARFASLGFAIVDDTVELMRTISHSGELQTLAAERLWQETARALGEPMPSHYFRSLLRCDALGAIFPELYALFGVPQRAECHPEVDAGEHSMLTVDRAADLSSESAVRFAALAHNLGKTLTDPADWPQHRNHEISGLKPIQQMCERLKVPNECREVALLASEHHLKIHSCRELHRTSLLKLLEMCDAVRRPKRFEQLLLVCQADKQSCPGLKNNPYPQRAYLSALNTRLRSIDKRALIQPGMTGEEIAGAIRMKSLDVISAFDRSIM